MSKAAVMSSQREASLVGVHWRRVLLPREREPVSRRASMIPRVLGTTVLVSGAARQARERGAHLWPGVGLRGLQDRGLCCFVCVHKCVHTDNPSTGQKLDSHSVLKQTACLLNWKLLSPLGNTQFQQLALKGKEPPSFQSALLCSQTMLWCASTPNGR